MYKNTLRLPNTTFAMQTNIKELGEKMIQFWKDINLFQLTRKENTTKYLHLGPPFANNPLHIGHCANLLLKDIIIRWWNLLGYNSVGRVGFDCHGLPVELNVQKKYKFNDVKEFRALCHNEVKHWINVQYNTMQSMGLLLHPTPYTTMDNVVNIYKTFSQLMINNKVFLARKTLPWSLVEKAVVPDIEIEYREKESNSVYVLLSIGKDYLAIWTTTPWSLVDNTGVAINKHVKYIKVSYQNKNIIIAKELKAKIEYELNTELTILDEFNGIELVGLTCSHPLKTHIQVPIIHSDHVTIEDGTGLVHCAPAHGEEDFQLYEQGLLDIIDEVNESGIFETSIPELNGIYIFDAEQIICNLLGNRLLKIKKILHRYPFSSRSLKNNVPLIYKTTKQIFVDIKTIQNKSYLINKLTHTEFFPEKIKNSLIDLISLRNEWCVSRQRAWGVPLCLFISKQNDKIFINEQLQKKIIEQLDKDVNFFFSEDCISILEGIVDPTHYYPYIGVLDVWFDSGCTFDYVTKSMDHTETADLYLEGKDQTRGWFQSSLLLSLLLHDRAPYKQVVTHGFLVDEQGYKISKSKGNGVALDIVIDKIGIEIMRIWVATIDFTSEMRIGYNLIDQLTLKSRKIRNVIRYLLSVTEDQNSFSDVANITDTIDRAMLEYLYMTYKNIVEFMNSYQINRAFTEIFDYITYISSFYFNKKKDILYCDKISSNRLKSTQKTCDIILKTLVILLGPILPFTMEEVFQYRKFTEHTSIHQVELQLIEQMLANYHHNDNWKLITKIYDALQPIRCEMERFTQEKIIHKSTELKVFTQLNYDLNLIQEILSVSSVESSSQDYIVKINNLPMCQRCFFHIDNIVNDLCERCHEAIKEYN